MTSQPSRVGTSTGASSGALRRLRQRLFTRKTIPPWIALVVGFLGKLWALLGNAGDLDFLASIPERPWWPVLLGVLGDHWDVVVLVVGFAWLVKRIYRDGGSQYPALEEPVIEIVEDSAPVLEEDKASNELVQQIRSIGGPLLAAHEQLVIIKHRWISPRAEAATELERQVAFLEGMVTRLLDDHVIRDHEEKLRRLRERLGALDGDHSTLREVGEVAKMIDEAFLLYSSLSHYIDLVVHTFTCGVKLFNTGDYRQLVDYHGELCAALKANRHRTDTPGILAKSLGQLQNALPKPRGTS